MSTLNKASFVVVVYLEDNGLDSIGHQLLCKLSFAANQQASLFDEAAPFTTFKLRLFLLSLKAKRCLVYFIHYSSIISTENGRIAFFKLKNFFVACELTLSGFCKLCISQFQKRPRPRVNTGAFDFLQKLWSNRPIY